MNINLKKSATVLVTAAVFAGIGYTGWNICKNMFAEDSKLVYITQPLTTGNMQRTIAATGTVEPEELVNVGAQVGGMITVLGTDADGKTVDYGSPVKAGMVLARIDDSLYVAEYESASAQNLQAEAGKANAEAGILQAKAKLAEAEASQRQSEALYKQAASAWQRAKQLQGVNARSEYEDAEAAFLNAEAARSASVAAVASAKASLTAAEAALQQAEAQIISAKAALSKAKRNLDYCVIKSPVDGVVIDRRVNVGQTVNSSMNAPSLFLIAKDLRKMQVWVSVNEADIGQIRIGQKTTFTVDAFPDIEFNGAVQKIRLNATMSQNVVTYVVEIGTDNSKLVLLPYLTANVKFILDERNNVLSIPNAALRFVPQDRRPVPQTGNGERIVWIEQGGGIRPVSVQTGLNDGMNTEVVSGGLTADMNVVTGSRTVSTGAEEKLSGGENPFMAKPPKFGGKKK